MTKIARISHLRGSRRNFGPDLLREKGRRSGPSERDFGFFFNENARKSPDLRRRTCRISIKLELIDIWLPQNTLFY